MSLEAIWQALTTPNPQCVAIAEQFTGVQLTCLSDSAYAAVIVLHGVGLVAVGFGIVVKARQGAHERNL